MSKYVNWNITNDHNQYLGNVYETTAAKAVKKFKNLMPGSGKYGLKASRSFAEGVARS